MKVLCIDGNMEWISNRAKPPQPEFGDIDEVIEDGYDEDLGEYYCLARFGDGVGFSQIHFIPISDIDETEMIRKENLQEA